MRTPHRRRPRKSERLLTGEAELAAVAAKVTYVPSREHKDYFTTAGVRGLRSDATPCPRLDLDDVVGWLRSAVTAGQVSATLEGPFPKYAWIRVAGQVYEARLTNSGLGAYKGYPILDSEAPKWLA